MLPIVITNSKLAKLLNVYYITIFMFTFTKETNGNIDVEDYQHEQIHFWQWLETTLVMLILACFLAYFGLISWWCTSLSIFIFYALYGLEWLCKFAILYITKTKTNVPLIDIAYYNISAEIEAFAHSSDINYKNWRKSFNWLRNLFKLNRYER